MIHQYCVFHVYEIHNTDELFVLSGYLGPKPVARLEELPFNSKVIYGMYGSEGIKPSLHGSLLNIQNTVQNLNIFYSNLPVHSKCYVWRRNGEIIHALIGSANFSVNGLTTPFREVLAETTFDTFAPLNEYIRHILNNSISCLEVGMARVVETATESESCLVTLLSRDGEVQNAAGLNWGQNPNNHTTPNDAYIAIRTFHIRANSNIFPPKQLNPMELDGRGRMQRHNDSIEIIWDDGVTMEGLLEGSQPIDDIIYPKQISSFPVKAELGEYIRQRLGVPSGQPVRKHHLQAYGRLDIEISLLSDGVYKFDFSV
ncbi:MAG: NgoFVII family restriction endonuclease [Bacteroidales bacterium]|nr:NgoFVII family restriction endonuclease [Bacteroidales bacterium]